MQVHAFDEKKLISASEASQGASYRCQECLAPVRLRKGRRCILHFSHLRPNHHCRQAKKGVAHLRLQQRVQSLFEDASSEVAFPSIGRVADVACTSSKIVYEIQSFPTSIEEAKGRITDYRAVGYTVVWILHDQTFNRRKQAPLKQFLQAYPRYYYSVDKQGEGIIYDQLERHSQRLPVNLAKRFELPHTQWPKFLHSRISHWPFYHRGDLLDLYTRDLLPSTKHPPSLLKRISDGYLYLLHWSLERSSK